MNEKNMMDWQGNIVEERHRERILVEDLPENEDMSAAAMIGAVESQEIDRNFERIEDSSWPLEHDSHHYRDQQTLSRVLSARCADS
jgi:hypothetical protein